MRIVLSRKGFDSANGGGPSPILPDGGMLSLPIPARAAPVTFGDITARGENVGRLVEALTSGRIGRSTPAHLDPDLSHSSIPRITGWRPAFGQVEAAQAHLEQQGVGVGDVFLFFGWFREVERTDGGWRVCRRAPDRHVLFGWLQVGDVIPVTQGLAERLPWLSTHPHLHFEAAGNTIYVARDWLDLHGQSAGRVPGAGVFPKVAVDLVLTAEGQGLRSAWSLPEWFHPRDSRRPLSYHGDLKRWGNSVGAATLRTVGRGQEFVLQCDDYPEAVPWATKLISKYAGA